MFVELLREFFDQGSCTFCCVFIVDFCLRHDTDDASVTPQFSFQPLCNLLDILQLLLLTSTSHNDLCNGFCGVLHRSIFLVQTRPQLPINVIWRFQGIRRKAIATTACAACSHHGHYTSTSFKGAASQLRDAWPTLHSNVNVTQGTDDFVPCLQVCACTDIFPPAVASSPTSWHKIPDKRIISESVGKGLLHSLHASRHKFDRGDLGCCINLCSCITKPKLELLCKRLDKRC
mmetsp:Transcript_91493/g.229953  ORF Transcript_91493/g.229953 Transcript_91493/m.229953 type:complete len:232 (-) Transcript_91493:1975-2670(-)